MVDREARDKSAEILRHFVVGQSFNFDFQDSQPTTKDPVIDAIWDSLWPFYCDVRKHKMKNEWAIPEEGKRKIANWLLFLYTDEEYCWPRISFPGVRPQEHGYLAKLLGLHRKQSRFLSSGAYEIWPFINHESFENAKKHPRLLANGS
jgi:hypothetical protein